MHVQAHAQSDGRRVAQASDEVGRASDSERDAWESELLLRAQRDASGVRPTTEPFGWASDNGASFSIQGMIQFRYAAARREGSTDDYVGGFEHRRTRFDFNAALPGDRVRFRLQPQFARTGALGLLDAYGDVDLDDNWSLRAGLYKLPFDREILVSARRRLFNERSAIGTGVGIGIGSGRSEGVMLTYRQDALRWSTSISDGAGGNNTTFLTNSTGGSADWAITSRVEVTPIGGFSTHRDQVAFEDQDRGLMLGAAAHLEGRDIDADGDGSFDDDLLDFRFVGDISYEEPYGSGTPLAGLSALAGVYGRLQMIENTSDVERYGVLAQAGYLIDEDTQILARYEWATGDDASTDLNQITLGVNEFFMGTNVRVGAEVLYAIDTIDPVFASSGQTILPDQPGNRGQIGLRVQATLAF